MKAGNIPRNLWLLAVAALLVACGGGGGHQGSVSQLPPSIRYPVTSGFVVGAGITPLRPLISGDVTGGFTTSPPLPPGLEIDSLHGTIFGTPTAPVPATIYTVDATSPDGRVTTTVSLTVVDLVPDISYSPNSRTLTQNVPLAADITPSNSGGPGLSWSIDRVLPAGLTFDTGSGAISGTPTASSPQTGYLVTATNTGGTASTTLTLTVQAASGLGGTGLRSGARAPGTEFVSVAGKTTVVQSGRWLTVSGKNTLLSNIELPAAARWWQLAADGSYIVAATDSRLTAWSPAGAVLFTKQANYGDALVFAAAGELRIGAGPAGDHLIETLTVTTGVARLGPVFQGSFRSWSEDGETFIAGAGSTAWSYSRDAARREIVAGAHFPLGQGQ